MGTMKLIGKTIREFRLRKDWTLADLSKRSGVALSTLSRIESGKMTGTLESHVQIAHSLGVRLPELYADLDSPGPTVEHRPAAQQSDQYKQGKGASFAILTSNALHKKMLPTAVTLQAGKSTSQEQAPVGTERFLYLIKGKLEVAVGNERVAMKTGDSLYLQASIPHHLKNTGSSPAVALSVMTPPSV